MYKQSAYVIALLLGASSAYRLNFATGMNGDEDLGEKITMKGEKFSYAGTPISAPERNRPGAANSTAAGRYAQVGTLEEENVQLRFVNNADPAEGVLFPQTGHAIHHSTYYAKKTPESMFLQDEEGSSKGTPTEGVHTLAPTEQQATANGPSEFAYPNQRTTFYAQGPLAEPEKVHTLDPKIARTHTTFYDKQNGLWRGQEMVEKKAKIDPIAPTNYDPWVYETSKEGMPSQRQWHAQVGAQSLAEDTIGTSGYNKQVHDFTEENIRAYNNPPSFAQKQDAINNQNIQEGMAGVSSNAQKKDLNEEKMEPNVFNFTNPLVNPLNEVPRSTEAAPALNGHKNVYAQQSVQNLVQRQNRCKDIGETNCDEEVHGFVKENVPPLNEAVKSTQPFVPNGSHPTSHVQVGRKDIAEPNMDEEVHGFANENVDRLPYVRPTVPYAPNGSDPRSHAQKDKKDIGETNCDEEVHGFVNANVPPLNEWEKSKTPYAPNGSDPSSHVQKKQEDIANKEIRPDVWKTVHEMINPAPLSRTTSKAPEPEEDVQLNPERVHTLEPIAFQHRANTNSPGPRTTFYDKQNRLWRQEEEM